MLTARQMSGRVLPAHRSPSEPWPPLQESETLPLPILLVVQEQVLQVGPLVDEEVPSPFFTSIPRNRTGSSPSRTTMAPHVPVLSNLLVEVHDHRLFSSHDDVIYEVANIPANSQLSCAFSWRWITHMSSCGVFTTRKQASPVSHCTSCSSHTLSVR